MSDFGANIFDDRHPAPEPQRPKKGARRRPPAAAPEAPPPAAPLRVEEVPLRTPDWVHDDANTVLFEAPAKAPQPPAAPVSERPAPERAEAPPPAPPAPPAPRAVEPAAADRPPAPPRHGGERHRDDRGFGDRREAGPRPADRRQESWRGERGERPDRPDRPDRSDRLDRPERTEGWRHGPRRHDDRGWDRPHGAERTGPSDRGPRDDRQDRPRDDRRDVAPPAHRPAPRDEGRPHGRPPHAAPSPAPRKVAILVDMLALQAEARAQGGELSLHRLRGGLAGDRNCVQAVCYAPRGSTPPNGFELRPNEDNVGGIGLAAAALELVAGGNQLVLAPPSPAIRQLAAALRKAGHRVELAGFVAADDEGAPIRRLGRDCLFVP